MLCELGGQIIDTESDGSGLSSSRSMFASLDYSNAKSISFHWRKSIAAILLEDGTIRINDIHTSQQLAPIDVLHLKQQHSFVVSWRPCSTETLCCSVRGGLIFWFFCLFNDRLSAAHQDSKKLSHLSVYPFGSKTIDSKALSLPTAVFISLPLFYQNDDVTLLDWSVDGSIVVAGSRSAVFLIHVSSRTVFKVLRIRDAFFTGFAFDNTILLACKSSVNVLSQHDSLQLYSWKSRKSQSFSAACWFPNSSLGLVAEGSGIFLVTRKGKSFELDSNRFDFSQFFNTDEHRFVSLDSYTLVIASMSIDPTGRRLIVSFRNHHPCLLFSISSTFQFSFIGFIQFEDRLGHAVDFSWCSDETGSLVGIVYGSGFVRLFSCLYSPY
ncbi:hypothetical protein RCL1_007805 [Eukaryota sp. TZLM3-RCL]